jgi:hypothetical protein
VLDERYGQFGSELDQQRRPARVRSRSASCGLRHSTALAPLAVVDPYLFDFHVIGAFRRTDC